LNTGNEADVELYVDHTGLMWENAQRFGAALVFAEHRYYGLSKVFDDNNCDMSLLTTEQALADYAVVVDTLKAELQATAVIGFGGSYGGMLATVFKFQYTHLVDGVIAASAPVLAYQNIEPKYDSNGFARVVTRDAGDKCAQLVKAGLTTIALEGKSEDGRKDLSSIFHTCQPLRSEEDAQSLLGWVSSYWDYLAMGDFPYPSSYVVPDGGMLPAYPVKAACKFVVNAKNPLEGLALGANMFYNATKSKKCLFNQVHSSGQGMMLKKQQKEIVKDSNRGCEGDWDWQWCTEHSMPFTSGTEKDMFYPPTGPFDPKATAEQCIAQWGVEPNPFWAQLTYGGLEGLQRGLRNVVFSNGLLDPWSAGGIVSSKGFDESVICVLIPHGAHHLDLMFSHKDDPLDVKIARRVELLNIEKWIKEAKKRHSLLSQDESTLHAVYL